MEKMYIIKSGSAMNTYLTNKIFRTFEQAYKFCEDEAKCPLLGYDITQDKVIKDEKYFKFYNEYNGMTSWHMFRSRYKGNTDRDRLNDCWVIIEMEVQ